MTKRLEVVFVSSEFLSVTSLQYEVYWDGAIIGCYASQKISYSYNQATIWCEGVPGHGGTSKTAAFVSMVDNDTVIILSFKNQDSFPTH